jgi:RNA polymerase sigma factor (sigma-70 family)
MAISPMPSEPTPEQLYLAHLDHIDRVAAYFCRRRRFSREETQDFVSKVHVKLIDDGYAIIRKFQGKCSFKTYLTVVIQRLFLDHLDHLWGKWRHSAEAERLGPVAIRLERLLYRDGFSFDEACEILWTNYHVAVSRQELADLAAKLPHRAPPRRMESEETLKNRPSKELTPRQRFEAGEKEARLLKVLGILREILDHLPAEDRVFARLSTERKISEIARGEGVEQKPLYRRLDKILKRLQQELESRGIHRDEIRELLGGPEDGDGPH